jgi:hypothetical protein
MSKSKRNKLEAEDISILYDLAWNQFKEDRAAITKQYQDLKEWIEGDKNRYAFNGDTLSKFSDQMIKQTAQVVELIKIAHKSQEEDGSLSTEELADISKEIEKETKEEDNNDTEAASVEDKK